jgi:hypothetical protein
VDVDLEVEVAAGADRVAGFANSADALSLPHPLALTHARRARHVGVEVAALLAFAVDQQVPAVEDRVVAAAQDAAIADGDQRGAAGRGDIEAFMDATAAARRVVGADRAAGSVRSLDREDVAVIGEAAVAAEDLGRGGSGECRDEDEGCGGEALQWCSITRSTIWYSFASSALMK